MISLEDHERDRFAAYLEQEAQLKEQFAKQLGDTEFLGPMRMEIVKRDRACAAAFKITAAELRKIETQTIRSGEQT